MADSFDVQIKVNGKDLPLNPFIQDFLGNTLYGMLRSLKGVKVEEVRNMEITVEKK